ncbi:MAG: TlpA family protein disulfide reductase [Lentimicrobium sp.]|nr:TlpA family protein disulfide reductase [Lentimicrobium sp.]
MRVTFIVVLFVIMGRIALSQDIKVLDYKGIKPIIETLNDTTYVVNFWATWCSPCVKELPYFQKLHDNFRQDKVKVLLVSLDFVKQIDSRLKPFLEKNKITPQVLLLSDPDANYWINEINPEWSGALPATIIFNRNFYRFYEKSFTYEELELIINQNIIKP